MKAQTFLEFIISQKQKYSNKVHYIPIKPKLINFCSQPFKPELITELFEGWKQDFAYFRNSKFQLFIFNGIKFYTKEGVYLDESTLQFITLNDFISDCNRAGIELHWRPETEKEYFV